MAAAAYHGRLTQHRDNPSEQTFWRTDLFEKLWNPTLYDLHQSPTENVRTGRSADA